MIEGPVIILLSTAFGFGTMALLAIAFGVLERRIAHRRLRAVMHGLCFGSGAILAMMEPVHLAEGVIADDRAVFIGLAAVYGGWPASAVAAALACAYRLQVGGAGALAGVAAILLAAVLGHVWAYFFRPREGVDMRGLAGLGAFVALYTTSALVVPEFDAPYGLLQIVAALVVTCIIGSMILGSLIERERQHIRTETYWKKNAHTDPLTQIPNRRWFETVMDADLAPSRRIATHALLVVDVDHFKIVNDRYGHPAGDAALVFIAGILGAMTRTEDRICRLGGEEFAIFVTGTSDRAARRIASAVRRAVCERPFVYDGVVIPLSVSIGAVIRRTPPTLTAGEMFQAADRALYEAKARGRNRVVVFALPPGERETDRAVIADADGAADATLELLLPR